MKLKKFMASTLALTILGSSVFTGVSALEISSSYTGAENGEIVILHTNDTHCDIENGFGFAGVKEYKDDMESLYGNTNVTLVDAGDAVQGGAIGKLTSGEAIIDLMNEVGYDIFTPGNHEFDYQMEQFYKLMNSFNGSVISSNFIELSTNKSVYDAYEIVSYGDFEIAYVGITTPETFTKSTPAYFQDGNGNFIYSFSEGNNGQTLYNNVQNSVDKAISEGADYVVAVAHLGVEEGSNPYRSTDVIANTTGIDVIIDGHSHTTLENEIIKNKNGEDVILNQTGDKFENLGKITINNNTGEITAELISGDEETGYTKKDAEVQSKVDEVNAEFEVLLNTVIAHSEVDLVVNDPETGDRLIRNQETNLGDLCADAYRSMLDADVAIVNGGGIRADVSAGDITYGDVIAVHPWGNNAMSVEVSGQVILDALEMGAKSSPEESGGFMQVSGLTYTINTAIPSSVVTDEQGGFVKVDGAYRVGEVVIGGEPIDLDKMYVLAAHDYMLLHFGDGMTMFKDAKVVKPMFMVDNEVLMTYIQDDLNGVVTDDYANIDGQGRIKIVNETIEPTNPTEEPTNSATEETNPTQTPTVPTSPQTGDDGGMVIMFASLMVMSIGVLIVSKKKNKQS